jgi:competence protein ComEC
MTSPSWSVAVALVAVLLFDPLAALSAGFWLSFSAVAVIILVEGGRLQRPGALRAAASVQWLVTIALLPVTLLLFGTFSAIGPLVNAAAIPLFTFLLVPPVLVATALYLVPLSPAQFLADRLVDLAAWAAAAAWPWLARAADLPGALWSAGGSWLWMCLAVPAAACVLLPLPPLVRSGACALLCSGFLLRASPPAAGSLQVTVFDAGTSRAVLLRTAHHQLLAGLGESFGTAGRRFETRLLPELLRDGRTSVEILMERTDRDSMRALAMAHARLSLQRATAAQPGAAPELAACADRRWNWDGVRFSQRALPSGCWLWAEAGGRLLVLAPERIAAGQWPGLEGTVSLVVLPRRARDAGSVLRAPWARDALALASVGDSEWQSNSWRAVRNARSESRQVLWSTAASGTLRLSLDAHGVEGRGGSAWAAGIWSTPGTGAQCRRLP